MKKLMITAAAALCATVGLADGISSQNVVGYNQVALNAGGKNMVGPCFISVGTDSQVKLSELKVVGYENSEYYLQVEWAFGATFQRRATNGQPYATYMWSDTTDDGETWNGGVWTDAKTGEPITAENDVYFIAGDGLWFDTPELNGCDGFYLSSSGQVLVGDQSFPLNDGGKIGVCNMLPVATTLSKIEIQGYENSEYFLQVEWAFGMTMQSLATNGQPLHTYMWSDSTDDGETWNGGAWTDAKTGEPITAESDVTIKPGEGFWADTPDKQDCEGLYFVVPKAL